jgi:predicted permease
LETLIQDVRYAFRALRKSPGFTAVAVVTLALGIGANTAIFSVVDAVVLRTLPVRDPSQLFYANPRHPQAAEVSCNVITSDFFRTMGIPLLHGQDFTNAEEARSSKVAVVSESFARRFFAGQNAIGQTFHFQNREGLFTVVGVVKDVRSAGLRGNEPGRSNLAAYLPLADAPQKLLGQANLEILVTGDSTSLTAAVRQRVQSVDKDLTFRTVETQASMIDESLGTERALAALTTGFGVIALLLAGIGLFGLTAYSVAQRTREIGIRMALGAQRMSILDLIVREAMLLTLAGLGIGLGLALVAGRLIAAQLFGVAPSDGLTISSALALMVAVTGAASLAPARRATKVDPMVALRYE